MKYVMIFHANLSYAYLTPDRYEFVIRKSYELILDTMAARFPDVKFVFEASGYTVDEIARRCPDVLEKLKVAIAQGRCEFMGSPYAHPMLPNFPEEDGVRSIRFSNEATSGPGLGAAQLLESGMRLAAVRAAAGCGGRLRQPDRRFRGDTAGRCDASGKPLRPEIHAKEHTKQKAFYHFGFKYDLPGTERAIHFPFQKIAGLRKNALRMFLRTDRIAQFGVRYFMGMEGYTFAKYMALINKYSQQLPGEPEGAVIIFADDAEYVGTNGWFRLKYENKPDNTSNLRLPRGRSSSIW